jgi:perosamine synthetase
MASVTGTPVTARALPALYGGAPVRATLLPYGRQTIEDDDIEAVVGVMRGAWLTTGPKVNEFESAFAAAVGARDAVAFSSGTAALHGAAFAAGLGEGDEAITTPLTFCATANCVLYQGARPVFADVEPETLTIDPDEIRRRITPRTRAIFPVDYAGHPAHLAAIREIAERHKLLVIEDACHALGAEDHGRKVGSLSDMTVFSFHPVKHITTGEGGMVSTNDVALAERLRRFRNHGIDTVSSTREARGDWRYEMQALGFNYRLTDIACALGLSQLAKLDRFVARRRAIAARYHEAFRGLAGLVLPAVRPDAAPSWHLYPVRVEPQVLRVDRGEVFRALRAENIGVNVHYIPVHLHPYYRDRFGDQTGAYPVSEEAYARLLSLPMFPGMSDTDVEDVVKGVIKVVSYLTDTKGEAQ